MGYYTAPYPFGGGKGGGGVLSLWPNFQKKGSLAGSQFLEGGDFFQRGGGCSFYIKNKLKSEIFKDNNKKVYKQKCFSLL